MHNTNYKRSAAYNRRIGDISGDDSLGLDTTDVSTDDSTGVSLITPGVSVADNTGSYIPNVSLTAPADSSADNSYDDLGLGTYSSTPEEGDSTIINTSPATPTLLQSAATTISNLLNPSKTTVPASTITPGATSTATTTASTIFTPANIIIAGIVAYSAWRLTKKKKR
jgi:hypothetical protein